MILRQFTQSVRLWPLVLFGCLSVSRVHASYGDRLLEFRDCVEVCKEENCVNGEPAIPLLHKVLLWDCPSECDYACQHIITEQRVASSEPIVQFHGKWPFHRFLGMQEPFSVLFSLFNFLAHQNGLHEVLKSIPASYPLREYYVLLAYFGMASWLFSMIFHTRDFALTEQLDYFAAGASVLYGLYYATVKIFGLVQGPRGNKSLLQLWTIICITAFIGHVTYLKWYSWDYTYNMVANVTVGIIQNIMWSWYSIQKYKKLKKPWATLPGVVVACILAAMSLELFDFPPWWGCLDAHSLWHLATVAPTWLWYKFLLRDAWEDIDRSRLKA